MTRTFSTRALRKHVEGLVEEVGGSSVFCRSTGVNEGGLSRFIAGLIPLPSKLAIVFGVDFDIYKGLYVQRADGPSTTAMVLNAGLARENRALADRAQRQACKIASQEGVIKELRAQLAQQGENA